MPSNTISVYQLWVVTRGCENALRAYADIIKGSSDSLPGKTLTQIDPHDASAIAALNDPFHRCCIPDPPGCPPNCIPNVADVTAGMQDLSNKVSAISRVMASLMDQVAARLDADQHGSFRCYVSEEPGTSWEAHPSP